MAYNAKRTLELLDLPRTSENIEELITLNDGLVYAQLHKFGMSKDCEAKSFALEALFKAIITFKPDKGAVFSTYATVCIYNALGSYLRGIKSGLDVVSYDALVGDGVSFLSMMESSDTADGAYLDKVAVINTYRIVIVEIGRVNRPTYKKVLNLWLNSNFKATQEELAVRAGCSQSYVSRILLWFYKLLKNKLQEE
jgi:DNA-directed RNA polymerase specialized sigma subunit